jgi:hypothetical protein
MGRAVDVVRRSVHAACSPNSIAVVRFHRHTPCRVQSMASRACCAAGAPVRLNYEPVGAITEEGGVKYYLVGSGPAGVVIVTDIFGFDYKQVGASGNLFVCLCGNPRTITRHHQHPHSMCGRLQSCACDSRNHPCDCDHQTVLPRLPQWPLCEVPAQMLLLSERLQPPTLRPLMRRCFK